MSEIGQRREPRLAAGSTSLKTLPGEVTNPSVAELAVTVVIGAFWLILVDIPRQIQFGPMTLSGAITILTAALTLCCLPSYAINSAVRSRLLGRADQARLRIPWPLWGFVLFVSVSFIINKSGRISSESIQNVCVYLSFVGAIAFAATIESKALVLRGWSLMRKLSVWFAYLALGTSVAASGAGLADDRLLAFLYTPRSMAIVGLIALAMVIPGKAGNIWTKCAPVALVAAMALTLSRSSTAIGLALLVFVVLRGKRRSQGKPGGRLFKAIAILSGVGLTAYCLFIFYAPFRDRFLNDHDAVSVGGVSIGTEGRATVWKLMLSNASDHWLFGHGAGSASELIMLHFPGRGLAHPHNEYIRFYFDFGIIGLSLFVVGYLTLIWRVFRNARQSDHPLHWSALIALVGVGLVAITDNPFVYPFVLVPLGSLAGLSLALARFELGYRSSPAQGRLVGDSSAIIRE